MSLKVINKGKERSLPTSGSPATPISEQDSELTILQAQVRHNDTVNEVSRNQINYIFQVSDQLQNGVEATAVEEQFGKFLSVNGVPNLSVNSIKSLSIQMNKLRLLELKIRVNSLTRTIDQYKKKNETIKEQSKNVRKSVSEGEKALESHETKLVAGHKKYQKELQDKTTEYTVDKIGHIQQQSRRLEVRGFGVLKEAIFSRSPKDNSLLFFNQPILKLGSFFGTNIVHVNQFLENLIVLQQHISFLFNIRLPHLNELIELSPDTRFYNLIKEKEILVTGKNEEEDEAIEEMAREKEREKEKEQSVKAALNSEHIIKLGDTIKLPLSSKTINNQRRASLLRAEANIPIVEERSASPPTSPPTNTNTNGTGQRKMIIIPHKILNKPFNKLSRKEFLRFLVAIAKILSNFMVFFRIVSDDTTDILDFELILEKIYNCNTQNLAYHKEEQVTQENIKVESEPDLIDKLNLKQLMEQVYKQLSNPPKVKGRRLSDQPLSLQDLNISALLANSPKLQTEEWDVVSKII